MINMNFTVSKNRKLADGTTFQGYLLATYDKICSILGEPQPVNSGDGKVSCEWILVFNCGTIATIYDWKAGIEAKDVYNWSIGGKGINIAQKVGLALKTQE